MGRGRQKAKHTKVARELKYFSPQTDLSELQRELATSQASDEDLYIDKWAADVEGDDVDNDEDEED